MAIDHRLDAGVVPAGFTLDEVIDDQGRLDYLAVTVEAYADSFLPRDAGRGAIGHPRRVRARGVRAVVARRAGQPVAAAMVVASAEVAGIQLVGTIPDAGGRGLGELCTRWAVGAGFDLGAKAVVLRRPRRVSRCTCAWGSLRSRATAGADARRRDGTRPAREATHVNDEHDADVEIGEGARTRAHLPPHSTTPTWPGSRSRPSATPTARRPRCGRSGWPSHPIPSTSRSTPLGPRRWSSAGTVTTAPTSSS